MRKLDIAPLVNRPLSVSRLCRASVFETQIKSEGIHAIYVITWLKLCRIPVRMHVGVGRSRASAMSSIRNRRKPVGRPTRGETRHQSLVGGNGGTPDWPVSAPRSNTRHSTTPISNGLPRWLDQPSASATGEDASDLAHQKSNLIGTVG